MRKRRPKRLYMMKTILIQVCFSPSMFFYLIRQFWSFSNRLSCISLLRASMLGRNGQWQRQWFLDKPLESDRFAIY